MKYPGESLRNWNNWIGISVSLMQFPLCLPYPMRDKTCLHISWKWALSETGCTAHVINGGKKIGVIAQCPADEDIWTCILLHRCLVLFFKNKLHFWDFFSLFLLSANGVNLYWLQQSKDSTQSFCRSNIALKKIMIVTKSLFWAEYYLKAKGILKNQLSNVFIMFIAGFCSDLTIKLSLLSQFCLISLILLVQ